MTTAPVTGLVLSGGGARGGFEAGVAQTLQDVGIRPTVISGTSAGALTGAAMACGWSAERITELWCSLESVDVMRPRADLHTIFEPSALLADPKKMVDGRPTWADGLLDLIAWTWLFHLEPLRELLVDQLGGEQLPVEDDRTLVLSAVAVDTGQPVRFSNRPVEHEIRRDPAEVIVTDLTIDHLLASAAIPGLFQPIEIDGTTYWDGVLAQNTPVTGALDHRPDRVLVVGPVPDDPPSRPPDTFADVVALAIAHVLRDALVQDVRTAEHTDDDVADHESAADDDEVIEMITVVPETPIIGLGDLLDFEPAVSRELAESGRDLTASLLADRGWSD